MVFNDETTNGINNDDLVENYNDINDKKITDYKFYAHYVDIKDKMINVGICLRRNHAKGNAPVKPNDFGKYEFVKNEQGEYDVYVSDIVKETPTKSNKRKQYFSDESDYESNKNNTPKIVNKKNKVVSNIVVNNNDMVVNDMAVNDMVVNVNDMAVNDNNTVVNDNNTVVNDNNNIIVKNNNTIVKNNNMIVKNNNTIVKNNNTIVKNNNTIVNDNNAIVSNNNTVVSNNNAIVKNNNTVVNNNVIANNMTNKNVFNNNFTNELSNKILNYDYPDNCIFETDVTNELFSHKKHDNEQKVIKTMQILKENINYNNKTYQGFNITFSVNNIENIQNLDLFINNGIVIIIGNYNEYSTFQTINLSNVIKTNNVESWLNFDKKNIKQNIFITEI